MGKQNCWEFMKCGLEPGGAEAAESGPCPVAIEISANSLNNGVNGGRICWIVADTCFKDSRRCAKNKRKDPCFACEFRFKVMAEEGMLNVCNATGSFLETLKAINKSARQINAVSPTAYT